MKTAYFDCIFGVSGDMILGALVACGLPITYLREELGKLGLHGFELTEKVVTPSGISAVHVDVMTEHQHEHRNLSHIIEIIGSSNVSIKVKDQATRIFNCLAEAEAKVHGTTKEKIHFHEIGALDAIVDIVGVCIGLEYFGIERVVSTPLRLGTGMVKCAHGVIPVPVPAVAELIKNVPVVRTLIEGEMTTPTGAAIVTTLASSYGYVENFITKIVGYGAGSRQTEDYPNVLRITIGDAPGSFDMDQCLLLETNIDNMNPEVYGFVERRLFEAGAKDVFMCPIYMKKGRPGTLLSVLTDDGAMERLLELMFMETTTIGVRITRVVRKKLKRDSRTVQTEIGPIRIKVADINGHQRYTPEFEDCARIAREKGIPLITVYDIIQKQISL